MNSGTLIKIPNDKKNNKNHHEPVVYNFSKLGHKKLDSIQRKLEKLVEKKGWQADVKEHPFIKNAFQVILSEENLCLFKVTCFLNGKKGRFDLYSKNSGLYSTANLNISSLSFGIKLLEGVNV